THDTSIDTGVQRRLRRLGYRWMSVEERRQEETPAPGAEANTVNSARWELVQVDRARVAAAAIVAVAIDPLGGTFFPVGANGQGVAIVGNRRGNTEAIHQAGVGRLDIRILLPATAAATKQIGRASVGVGSLISFIAIDAWGPTVF